MVTARAPRPGVIREFGIETAPRLDPMVSWTARRGFVKPIPNTWPRSERLAGLSAYAARHLHQGSRQFIVHGEDLARQREGDRLVAERMR